MNFARAIPDPVSLALQELEGNDYAVALARVVAVARKETASLDKPGALSGDWPAFNALIDSFALCRDCLDDYIILACVSHDLDRSDLPSTGELVDRLAAQS